MALPIFSSLPFTFNKTPFPKNGSLSLPIWNSNFHLPIQCKATHEAANDRIPRRSHKDRPSIWSHDYIQSLNSEYKEEIYAKKLIVLREEVRMMFNKMENEVDQLEFIDVLQRLGVDYHFNNEIRNMLDNIYNTQTSNLKNNNLYVTALKFRLLRQHGYDISTDVFVCFRDEMLDLKTDHAIDVEGMLSMYEASFHSFEDETILDEARDFTIKFLKDYLNKHGDDDVMSILISHAFEIPLHLRISRSEAQWFIDQYQKNKNMSPILLQFAKVDYNILQSIYQEELKYDSRWWKGTGYEEKLTFARDRIVENYIWSVGTNFNPNSGYFRKYTTKILSLITTLDDVYDVYGTLEELELFTEAIDRWDLNGMDSLPNYMKICFEPIYNFVNELAFDVQNKSGCDITPHLKKAWIDLCKTYLVEAKWYHIGSTPNFEEYLENAWKSIGSAVILIHGFCYFQPEDSVCVEENLNIIHFSATILRLANDLGTYKRELETGDIPKSIQLYMNENDASETEAREYVKSLILTLWKKMNKEAHTSSFSRSFVDISINLARMSLFMYLRGDAHTVQDSDVKNRVVSLIFQHVPIMSTME